MHGARRKQSYYHLVKQNLWLPLKLPKNNMAARTIGRDHRTIMQEGDDMYRQQVSNSLNEESCISWMHQAYS